MNKPVLPPSRFADAPQPAGNDTPAILSAGEARSILVARLAALRVPRIAGEADGDDLRAIADHMVDVADAVDAWAAAIGRLIQSNSTLKIEQRMFEHPLFAGFEGNALFEVLRAADALDEETQSAALEMWT